MSRELDQNGSLKPGGRLSPEVKPDIFSWVVDSTRRTASLTAAATVQNAEKEE